MEKNKLNSSNSSIFNAFDYLLEDDCIICGRNNHTSDNCFALTDVYGRQIIRNDSENEEEEEEEEVQTCNRCGRNNHISMNCNARYDVYNRKLYD
jgi:rRNA maturation protein Nop10